MGILYTIIILTLLLNIILIKKSDKKQNIIFWFFMSVTFILILQVFECYLLTLIRIKNNLISLSIVNVICSALLGVKIYKDKKIQEYYIKIKDIIFCVVMLVLVVGIGYKQFGFPFNIKYDTTDPAIHYSAAKGFIEEQKTPYEASDSNDRMMPSAYVNTGIAMMIVSDFMLEENLYIIYILFDLFILYMIGATFFVGITNGIEGKTKSILAGIISIFFTLGYPLNSLIFGYAYLSVGLLFIIALIVCAPYIKNRELKEIPHCILFFAINFGIFFSYYLFVPVIYSAFGLYMLFDMIKNKKGNLFTIFNVKNIIEVIVILIIPTIMGFCYFVLPNILIKGNAGVSHLAVEGYIYRDLFSNYLFLLPFVVAYIIKSIKNRENKFAMILFTITALFTIYLFLGGMKGEVSSYYFYKMYFVLWILIMYITAKMCFELIDNNLAVYTTSYIGVYSIIIIMSLLGIDQKIYDNNLLFNPNKYLSAYSDIYSFNLLKIKSGETIYSVEQIETVNYCIQKADDRKEIMINGSSLQMLWARDLSRTTDTDNIHELFEEKDVEISLKEWLENTNKKYFIYLDKTKELEKETESYKTIYEVEDAIILEKK